MLRFLSFLLGEKPKMPTLYAVCDVFHLPDELARFPSERVTAAAPVFTMSDTCFFSVPVVNWWLLKFDASGSVVSVAAEHLLESCGSGRVSRVESWNV